MDGKTLTTGGLSLVVGLLIGVAIAPSGDDVERMEEALEAGLSGAAADFDAALADVSADLDEAMTGVSDGMGAALSGVTDTVQALDTRMSDLFARVESMEEAIGSTASAGAEATAARLDQLEARIEATAQEMQTALATTAGEQAAAVEAALASMTENASPTAEPEAPAPDPTDMSAAETVDVVAGRLRVLGPNTARVFITQVSAEDGVVHLKINGEDAQPLSVGDMVRVADCSIRVDLVDADKASLAHNC